MKIVMVINVSDEIDARDTDPCEVAESIVYEYNDWARANGEESIGLVEAEWEDNAGPLLRLFMRSES